MADYINKDINFKKKNPNHGKNIKWFRKNIDYSQEYLASLVGEKQQTISEWEKCEFLDDEILTKVATALQLNILWLRDIVMGGDGNQYYVESSGTNFISYENAQVAYAVHNPLETMEETYKNAISVIESKNNQLIQSLKELLEAEKEDKRRLMDMFLRGSVNNHIQEQNPLLNDELYRYHKVNENGEIVQDTTS